MKKYLIVMMALNAAHTQAQSNSGPLRTRPAEQLTQDSREAASRLDAARKSGTVEADRLKEAGNTNGAMAEKARQAATDLLRSPDPAETSATKRADETMTNALKNVTAEGRALLSKGAARGPTSAPPRAEDTKPEAAPKPSPLRPVAIENLAVPGSKVIITCTGAAFFDSETSIALFTENVEVRHPQFFVMCDEFEIHMIKEAKPAAGAPAKSSNPIKDPISEPVKPAVPGKAGAAAPVPDSSIKFAIARGRMVTIEKFTETGDIQIGHAKHATYDGATGDIFLRDFPQVQRGKNLQIATDPATTMVLKQNGALNTKGPSRTEIIQDDKPAPTRLNTPPPAPKSSPNPNTSPRQPR